MVEEGRCVQLLRVCVVWQYLGSDSLCEVDCGLTGREGGCVCVHSVNLGCVRLCGYASPRRHAKPIQGIHTCIIIYT